MARPKMTDKPVISITAARMLTQDKGHYGRIIKERRMARKIDQETLAGICNVQVYVISNWERGISSPQLKYIPILCEVLDITPAEFFDAPFPMRLPNDESELMKAYHNLNDSNRRLAVKIVSDIMIEQDRHEREEIINAFRIIPELELYASAGPGGPSCDTWAHAKRIYIRKNGCSEDADFLISVNGRSMEPDFPDGSKVYIKEMPEVNIGDICAFEYENVIYIKEYQADGMHSLNPDYPVMPREELEGAVIIGRVLGVVDEEDYPTNDQLSLLRNPDR